ncbi:hypothetical protein Tco_1246315 [Tanacetum coccineum]
MYNYTTTFHFGKRGLLHGHQLIHQRQHTSSVGECSASGSIRRPVAKKRHASQNSGVNFEDGSSKEPNVARGRRKKKSEKDSELGELEETMKNAITNIGAQENQGPTIDECHEKLKSMRDCMMVVKEIVGRLLEEEEKLGWWFEQDMDKEEERFKEDEDDGEV